jgi:Pyruvate/2-oxoglutarate dehydrogenase complex, dihydrolipoamide dehydrogenase (E3) component, and related enzymes
VSHHQYDIVVIGAGQAAMPLCFALAEKGKRVALVERKHLGGSCANFGCTPSKAVIASARVAHLARRGSEYGLKIPTVTVDFSAVLEGARAIARESRDGLQEDLAAVENPTLLRGHARLEGRDSDGAFRVRIRGGMDAGALVTAREVVLDTGTTSRIPPLEGLESVDFLTAENWLEQSTLPEHLVLLGGGYIGLEMAQFYRRMGSRVTVIDQAERLLSQEDAAVSEALLPLLEAEGIDFRLGAEARRVEKGAGGAIDITVATREGEESRVSGSHLFVAVGRAPNTGDLGLDSVGLELKEDGIVPVDTRLATPVKGLWAVGDIRGGPMFTHTSWDDHRVLVSQMLGDGACTADRIVPYAVFTDPQVARVGMTEAEAREAGRRLKTGRFEMCHNGHARQFREKAGFVSVVVDAETDRLLGATVVSEQAAELVHLYTVLMNADAPYTVIRDAVFTHPTLGEAAHSAIEAVDSPS